MDAFGGNSIGLSIVIGNVAVTDGVSEFTMEFPLNGFPYGEFTVTLPTSFTVKIKSGIYGALTFIDSGHSYFENSSIPLYIVSARRMVRNDNMMEYSCKFIVGTPVTMCRHTMAVPACTSVDAFVNAFKSAGIEGMEDRLTPAGVSPVDSMVWRFVNADCAEIGNDIVGHSCIPGEYSVWGYNERTGNIFITGYSTAIKNCVDYMLYSPNAKQATGGNCIVESSTGKTLWLYGNERKGNVQGELREAMFPDIVTSSVTAGEASISSCKCDCFGELASQVGAKNNDTVREEYGLSNDNKADNNDVYGELVVVSDFPNNTHKYYPVAEMLRGRLAAEYGKVMFVDIYNDVGPVVGTGVALFTLMPDFGANGPATDMTFTDRYVVVSKKVTRKSMMSGGIIGSANPDETPVMVTTLTLVSNGSGDVSVVEDLNSLLQSLRQAKLIPDGLMG